MGVASRVIFSLNAIGKRINWRSSRRLKSGSIVALTPADDQFRTICRIAEVAARPMTGLELNPPEIDLFLTNSEIELDTSREWIMVEHTMGYYEAHRHTMVSLQKMMRERFPLDRYIVDAVQEVDPPTYIQADPKTNINSVTCSRTVESRLEMVNILKPWPEVDTSLDESQMRALTHILTKALSIIQGPPGCGKTFVSTIAIRVLLDNMVKGDPPIIIACQTNHALDQILRMIAEFEPHFVRLGGRSKDLDVIKSRTLYEVRKLEPPSGPNGIRKVVKEMKALEKILFKIVEPLTPGYGVIDHDVLLTLGLITEQQADSLEQGDVGWTQADVEATKEDLKPMEEWLRSMLEKAPSPRDNIASPIDNGLEYEEADMEYEDLEELEAERTAKYDDELEELRGTVQDLGAAFVGKVRSKVSAEKVANHLKKSNLWDIPKRDRGAVYRFWYQRAKELIPKKFREVAGTYNKLAKKRQYEAWNRDALVLKQQRIVGLTTTGLSKYRGLIAAIKPRIVLIEEAAEVIEAPVTVACFDTLEHLILVGDHQQLRPNTQLPDFANDPYHLNMSLFERMILNDVEFRQLKHQRRMIPEIRRLLLPIYRELYDHESVKSQKFRPPIPGMGGVHSFFFTHTDGENKDENGSAMNEKEADMVSEFFYYLFLNGMPVEKITVLTFYNAQRKLILRKLNNRRFQAMHDGCQFNVVTVDSYQGEENDVILLSLVRSNNRHTIGFLADKNRICVAVSRAKRGFYMFGNGLILAQESKVWADIVKVLSGKYWKLVPGNTEKENLAEIPLVKPERRIGWTLPVQCQNHGKTSLILTPKDLQVRAGGCISDCEEILDCGHKCSLKCHP
jgi:helicase required for RNAi-mediated heterochromatin assembly 1